MKRFDCPHCHRIFQKDIGEEDVVSCPHCNGTVKTPEKDLPAGTIIGGFEIIRLLGNGGMGNVYLANQISMNRPVALKILLKSMTQDKEAVKQFLNEARVSGQMNHRNIITAIDAGEFEDRYFLVTSFVDGYDLEKILEEEKQISEKKTIEIAIKIADALQYAWESHGLLHKDIKPGNIMLDSEGEPYLMDMGIAQFIGDTPSDEEHILGSPFYMSPEQTRGERLSWTTDLYSLGATMYNMIVGLPPYDSDDIMKIIEMHSEAPFPMPKSRNPNIKMSKSTVMLLQKMMEKDADNRFDSWGGFKEALEKTLRSIKSPSATSKKKSKAPKPASASPKKKRRLPPQPAKKNSSGGMLFIIVIVILIIICIAATMFFFKVDKYNVAKKHLDNAEKYYKLYPGPDYGSVGKFKQALKYAKGTRLEDEARKRFNQALKNRKTQLQLIEKFKETRKTANALAKEKKYDDAINIIKQAVQDIKDKQTQAEAKMLIEFFNQSKRK